MPGSEHAKWHMLSKAMEARGLAADQLRHDISNTGGQAADQQRLGGLRMEIAGMLTRLEQSLTSVNSASTEAFPAAKAEALTTMQEATELAAKVKGEAK